MFTQKIIDSDPFLDMPLSAQALYFHLNMRADDDGFVNNPKRIQRTIGGSEDDLKLLLAKRFVIGFDSGVLVIKHWRMHNTLRKDRYNPTQYQEEFLSLEIKDNNAYTERLPELPNPENSNVATTWQPDGNHLEPQYSIDKYSIDKLSIEENSASPSGEAVVKAKPSRAEIDKLFEYLWSLYPNKKGKGQVSEAKRKALFEVGKDEMERAVSRYLHELKKDASWRKPQNGSTFFNSGYVDYLDKNFIPSAERVNDNGQAARDHGTAPKIGNYV